MFFSQALYKEEKEAGGAALEYIIVSVFGLILALGAMGLVSKAAQEKLQGLEGKLGVKFDLQSLNPLGNS